MKTRTLPLKHSVNRSHCSLALLLIPLALACTALSQTCEEGCSFGLGNTFLGQNALLNNTTGTENTANGSGALFDNTTGSNNTATGFGALALNTTGSNNTANGTSALLYNSTGFGNTATGFGALGFNTIGSANTATGDDALLFNTTGHDNIAEGFTALANNTTGSANIALGSGAGFNLTTGSNNIDIGNVGTAGESKHIRIGTSGTQTKTFIAGISGATVPGGVGVIVGTNGQLGTVVSSARFKDEVKPMDKTSEAILALKPVTFRYKPELDPEGIPQFGLVAEDVEKVNPDLVARDEQGKPYTVRYEAVNAMLLNEFLKEHRKVEEQAKALRADENEIAQVKSDLAEQRKNFESRIAQQEKQIGTLSAALQKVTARLESSPTTAKVVADN